MAEVDAWPPTRYSEPLRADFDSLFGRYRNVFRIAWKTARGYQLEAWQEDLLCHITELRPDGRLRWRQFLVSMGRQNGKTEIAAALGLLFLLWKTAPYVIGIASNAVQARLVYDRAMQIIRGNAALSARFERLTETRGIATTTGGKYEIKAAKTAALQGLPIDLGVADEVHLLKPVLWTDLVNGMGGRPDSMVVGITTAGDDNSELLKHLYALAAAGDIGHAIWEAEEARIPEDDEALARYLAQASPAIASGRTDVATIISEVRTMPPGEAIRYKLNRFTAAQDVLIPLADWTALAGEFTPPRSGAVFTVERSPGWEHASVVASWKREDGTFATQVVASVAQPNVEKLADICVSLAKHSPRVFAVDGYSLKGLGDNLKSRGLNVRVCSQQDAISASGWLYSTIKRRRLTHAADPLLTAQIPRAVRKNIGDSWRITRPAGAAEIDALLATALGVYLAEVTPDHGPQLFV